MRTSRDTAVKLDLPPGPCAPGPCPPGSPPEYRTSDDLLRWIGEGFKSFGDTYRSSCYGAAVYVTRNPEFARHVMVENWQNYVKGQFIKRVALLLGNGLMVSEGGLWKRQRRMIQPAFRGEAFQREAFQHQAFQHPASHEAFHHAASHGKSSAAFLETMTTVNSALLKKWQLAAQGNQSINVTRDVSGAVLEVSLRCILGEDYERVGLHFNLLATEQSRDLAFAQAFRGLGKFILQAANRRREERTASSGMPGGLGDLRRRDSLGGHDILGRRDILGGRDILDGRDILGMLMEARDPDSGQPMPDRQLINEILTLIVAAHETTASTINWTWYLISQHPEVEEKLGVELSGELNSGELPDVAQASGFPPPARFPYLRQVIEESMRLYPPGWLITRKALRDDRLGDYFVPAGTEIYVPPYFIQRHPDVWENPDRFNPDRFNPDRFAPDRFSDPASGRQRAAMLPFSAGPRNCIGEWFARLEMQMHFAIVASQLRLRYVQTKPLELDAGVNLRCKYDFIMRPEMRKA